jgi:predicted metal-dependent peptidase
MDGAALDRIAEELARLRAHAKLTVVECDAAVHRVYALVRTPDHFVGGGDTDFGPAFDEAQGARAFEGVVYFTDGKGDLPEASPAVPTLWVLTHEDPFEPGFGSIVRMAM